MTGMVIAVTRGHVRAREWGARAWGATGTGAEGDSADEGVLARDDGRRIGAAKSVFDSAATISKQDQTLSGRRPPWMVSWLSICGYRWRCASRSRRRVHTAAPCGLRRMRSGSRTPSRLRGGWARGQPARGVSRRATRNTCPTSRDIRPTHPPLAELGECSTCGM